MGHGGFNPRAHAGRDPHGVRYVRGLGCFNPRVHAGRDHGLKELLRLWRVSIHAPTRGATIGEKKEEIWIIVSIHAPTRGATLYN